MPYTDCGLSRGLWPAFDSGDSKPRRGAYTRIAAGSWVQRTGGGTASTRKTWG